jgi:signal peptidase I
MNRKDRKRVRELLKGARKLQHANSDVLSLKDNESLGKAIEALDAALRAGNDSQTEKAAEQLEKQLERIFPRRKDHWLRENIEVLLVAVVVAMAVRTYFLQPFKIPTGSMQPTLYGIHKPGDEFPPGDDFRTPAIFPLNLVEWLIWGRSYLADPRAPSRWLCQITGDHIFVDKVTYNFRKPRHGEVIVFSTDAIRGLDQDKFYIKRCTGLPGDRVEIRPPFFLVNGKKLEGKPFERIYTKENGYHGYTHPRGPWPLGSYALPADGEPFELPPKHYFACGDNSPNSLDSRYWGSVPEANLVGKALWTYWPTSRRWGLVK